MNNKEYDTCKETTRRARKLLEIIDPQAIYFPYIYLYDASSIIAHLQIQEKHNKDCLFYWDNLKEVLLKLKPLKERFEEYYRNSLLEEEF